jgi:signal transduction histidine kinase
MRSSIASAWLFCEAVLLCLAPVAALQAGVKITRVVVDGQEMPLPKLGGQDERPTIRVPSATRHLEIHYGGGWNAEPTSEDASRSTAPLMARGTRLRHRLDGVDADWQDSPAKARVFLQFQDAAGNNVASSETMVAGESPGWNGSPETSAFKEYRFTANAPPLAVRVTANFLSHGGDEVVGAIGIDDVVLSIMRQDGGTPVRHPLAMQPATVPLHPLDTPGGWSRRGSRGEIAQLRLRQEAEPHPILVLLDDDPTRYGNWSLAEGFAVEPGDRVTLSWTSSHSLGVGGNTVAEYRDPKPGTSWFRAGAFRPGGEPTGHEASLAIEVVVPWYQRPETLFAGIAFGAAGAFAIGRSLALGRIRRRLQAVEREHALERERARIARDLHDEVGAGLTEIAMQNFWVQRELEGKAPPATLDRVEKVRQSAVDLVRSVDAIVWAVNPANDTLNRFVPYLTHSVEQFLEAAGVRSRIDVPDRMPEATLDGTARHSLFLIVREAVNNAVKHAQPTTVGIGVRCDAGRLWITVEDDGCGIAAVRLPGTTSASVERSGLVNMRRRIEELGGQIVVESRADGGTRVAIDMPLPATSAAAVS